MSTLIQLLEQAYEEFYYTLHHDLADQLRARIAHIRELEEECGDVGATWMYKALTGPLEPKPLSPAKVLK